MKECAESAAFDLSLTTSVLTTGEIIFQGMRSGVVNIPTGSSITSLTYHGATTSGGTYLPLYDSAKNALTQTTLTAGRAYQMPTAVAGVAFLKIVVDAAGTVGISIKA